MRKTLVLTLCLGAIASTLRAQQGFLVRASNEGPEVGMIFRLARHVSLEPGVFVGWGSNTSSTDSVTYVNHSFTPGISAALRWTGHAGGGLRAAVALRGAIGRQRSSFTYHSTIGTEEIIHQRSTTTVTSLGATVGAQVRLSDRASFSVDYGVYYMTGHGTTSDSTYLNSQFFPQPAGTAGAAHTSQWYNYTVWTLRLYRRNRQP